MPTYPFPKPTFCPKWKVSVDADEREGEGGGESRGVRTLGTMLASSRKRVYFLLKGATLRNLSKPKSSER